MKLSAEQTKVFDQIMKWHAGPEQSFVLAGYAGAGKTTLAKYIAEAIGVGDVYFCAFTGKAANVLREKGCHNATTIHGAIYKLIGEDEKNKRPYFGLDRMSKIREAALVIVDEYSMLPKEIIKDLKTLASKILYLGDPFQLPPVNGVCDLEPDAFLQEIHRQALDNPIIRYATAVRNSQKLEYVTLPEFQYQPSNKTDPALYMEVDQVIVGFNKTRNAFNDRFRQKLGFKGTYPLTGEKLICLKNNHQIGLFNGMIGECKADAKLTKGQLVVNFEEFGKLAVWSGDFERRLPMTDDGHKYLDRFDFSYAITCHKSQGSEFNSILVYNEPIGRDPIERARWKYTAITRAAYRCIVVDPK